MEKDYRKLESILEKIKMEEEINEDIKKISKCTGLTEEEINNL